MRFVQPIHGDIIPPTYSDDDNDEGHREDDTNSNSNSNSNSNRRLLLVCGASGVGKTLASLYFALNDEAALYRPPAAAVAYRCGHNDSTSADSVTCVLYCKARDFEAKMSFTAFVEQQLLRGTPRTEVVPSPQCSVVVVVDELGASDLFVGWLVSEYACLTEELEGILQVESVRVIGAGTGVDGFDRRVPDTSKGLRRVRTVMRAVVTRRVRTAAWARLAESLAKLRPSYLTPAACIAKFVDGDIVASSAALRWLRAALTNARFATVFANHVMGSDMSSSSAITQRDSGCCTSERDSAFWTPGLVMGPEAMEGGLHYLTVSTIHHFSTLSGLRLAYSLFVALRNAIEAMIDRTTISDHWNSYIVTLGILTRGWVVVSRAAYITIQATTAAVDVLRSRIPLPPSSGGTSPATQVVAPQQQQQRYQWVNEFVEDAESYEVMRRGRPFYMVDRVYCSMFILLFGGCWSAGGVRPPHWHCGTARAVMDFAFFAASLNPLDFKACSPRQGVPPLRRLLNALNKSETRGEVPWRAAAPMRIDAEINWKDPENNYKAMTSGKSIARRSQGVKEGGGMQRSSVAAFWRELRTCVRWDRACVVTNGEGAEGAKGVDGFILTARVLALLQIKATHTVSSAIDRGVVLDAFDAMAPVMAFPDCVLTERDTLITTTRQSEAELPPVVEIDEQQQSDAAIHSDQKQAVETDANQVRRWQQQRVSEELVALACGVTFKRCPQTQRAIVRRPPVPLTTTTVEDTTTTAAVASTTVFIVNVAVVFEGHYASALQEDVLCNAFGSEWAADVTADHHHHDDVVDDGCSGPFAVLEATPGNNDNNDRARAEIVLDYLLEPQPRESDDDDDDDAVTRVPVQEEKEKVLRVAYRYFIVDVTWRRARHQQQQQRQQQPIWSDRYSFAWHEALPPLYPVPQVLFPSL